VGEAGLYAPSQDPIALARTIQQAMDVPLDARARARQRILDCFPMEKRQQSFEALIDSLLGN